MNFSAKTEKQLQSELLIPAGVYPFTVTTAENKKSKAGNDMIELELRVFMPDGRERGLRDWLMEKMAFKLFHFCAYTGLATKYEAGTLEAGDCVGRSGFAKIIVQADKQGQYPDRNSVADYARSADGKMPAGGGIAATKPQPTEAQLANQAEPAGAAEGADEDVPF